MHDLLCPGCTDAAVERAQSCGSCPGCERDRCRRRLVDVLTDFGVKVDLWYAALEGIASDAEDHAEKQDVCRCARHERDIREED